MKTQETFCQLLESIGDRLYTLRHERRQKLMSVASSVGISHPVISLVENGRYKGLTMELLYKLSSHYEIAIEDLFVDQKELSIQYRDNYDTLMQHLKMENRILKDILENQKV